MDTSIKIVTADEVPKDGTVVFTNGCFDILHAGHVRYLEACKEFGDILVVGLNSDASVKAQGKGEDRPIIPQRQRAELLAALQAVDYVVVFDEPTPESDCPSDSRCPRKGAGLGF